MKFPNTSAICAEEVIMLTRQRHMIVVHLRAKAMGLREARTTKEVHVLIDGREPKASPLSQEVVKQRQGGHMVSFRKGHQDGLSHLTSIETVLAFVGTQEPAGFLQSAG